MMKSLDIKKRFVPRVSLLANRLDRMMCWVFLGCPVLFTTFQILVLRKWEDHPKFAAQQHGNSCAEVSRKMSVDVSGLRIRSKITNSTSRRCNLSFYCCETGPVEVALLK